MHPVRERQGRREQVDEVGQHHDYSYHLGGDGGSEEPADRQAHAGYSCPIESEDHRAGHGSGGESARPRYASMHV